MDTITFNYTVGDYFESFKKVILSVRENYDSNNIFVYLNSNKKDLNKYVDYARFFECEIVISDDEFSYIHKNDSIDINLPKMVSWVNRINHSCINSESTWMMLLEDDVFIRKQIINFPISDCGTNRETFTLGGGSIFKRTKFLECIKNIDLYNTIKNKHLNSWAGDVLLYDIFKSKNCTFEKWKELAEPNYFNDTQYSVFHGDKSLHLK